jgi:signal transduction histidine kinase/AraC-like DNA-binding protein/ABC-type sugar transport system substrate-binding protein
MDLPHGTVRSVGHSRSHFSIHSGRPTLGQLTSQLNRGFHRAAMRATSEAVRNLGANFICFDGGVLAPAAAPDAACAAEANILYGLVGPDAVDGAVIWSSALDWDVGAAGIEAFCRRFTEIPVVSVGRAFDGIPSILVDNYEGMRAAVTHLIERHGYRRVAFLRGPEGAREADLRFRAYCDALADHDIPFEANLVAGPTNWERSDGPVAIRELLDLRGLRAGIDMQAIVSVGDDMACGVLETLQARGIRVPEDVAVIGFNDDDEGRAILPALTTVRQPVERMGRTAVTTLMALLSGRIVPGVVTLPLELVVRRSCGCLSPSVIEAAAHRSETADPLAHQMAQVAGAGADIDEMARLVDGFLNDVAGRAPGAFLADLNGFLQRHALGGRDVSHWHQVLSLMRRDLSSRLPRASIPAAEDRWQQARVLVGETAAQARAYQRFRAEQDSRLLGDFSQRIQTASDREALMQTLAAELPGLGVPACYLALHENRQEPQGAARLLFAFDRTGRRDIESNEAVFPAPRLLPAGFLPCDVPHNLVTLPLYFQQHQIGFLLLTADARGLAFSETLREQISSALAALFLREDLRRALQEAEEANNLKSRFLATVSHELRTPLSLITGTIEMMMRDQGTAALPAAHMEDLANIGASAQHLSRLIGDVLDLASSQAGELRLVLEPLTIEEVLRDVARLAEPLARGKGLRWRAEIPRSLPTVSGDRTRLRQVALNLVSNAIKFTEHGEVSLAAVALPDAVMVTVSDTGMGIPVEEQEAIFDEFRRSGRTTESGYGGMGLGLAISRRLVDLHGGHIGVHSSGEDGSGSTFFFSLPALAAEPCDAILPPADRSGKVLLLSERSGGSGRLREYLGGRGFDIEDLNVCDCPDWLDRIVTAPPGAVLLDYEPAAERGWELMRALKLNPVTRDVPVVFYTLSDTQNCGAILELDYLAKPAGRAALGEAMERQGIHPGECSEGRSILVVDDDPNILELHGRMVRSHLPDCLVLRAGHGREAVRIMARERPDLVLLDLMMPEMDGFDVLEAMREREETRRIPVIVLTAQILTAADMARLQRGVAAVLGKGLFTRDEVLTQVETALARSKRLGAEAQRVVRQAMAYIHEHYAEPVSREDLARHVAVSERYLTRCFQQEAGIAPITYLTRYRVKRARELLTREDLSITEVALGVGFSDSGYFSRVFRDEVGISPTAFQRGEHPTKTNIRS